MTMLTTALALSGMLAQQPQGGGAPILSDIPIAQVMMSVHVQRAPSTEWLDALTVRDRDSERVDAQGFAAGPRVYIGNHIALTDRTTPQDELNARLDSISHPRLLVLAGQEAEIVVGEAVSYAQLEDDGQTMRLVGDERHYEGLSITANPVLLDGGGIRFDQLDVALHRVVGRMDVTNDAGTATVALPAGRPIIESTSYSMPLTLPEGERAIVVLSDGNDDEVFVVTIDAEIVTPDE